MMHEFPDNQNLYNLAAPLFGAQRRVITFDFLGWGDSDKPTDNFYDVDSVTRDLDALVTELQLDDVVLVMHDASGQPGIDWAIDNPDKVAGLVLLNTYYNNSPTLQAPPGLGQFTAANPLQDQVVGLARSSDEFWLFELRRQTGEFVTDPTRTEYFLPFFLEDGLAIREAFLDLASVLTDELAARDLSILSLQDADIPSLFVFGADDPYLNVGVAEALASVLGPDALVLIDGAHHLRAGRRP